MMYSLLKLKRNLQDSSLGASPKDYTNNKQFSERSRILVM